MKSRETNELQCIKGHLGTLETRVPSAVEYQLGGN